MHLNFLGVRGSTPVMGDGFDRYGGHTSCVAVGSDDGAVRLVIDAGTGLSGLGPLLRGQPFRGSLLLGHLHWDHTQGLPFCPVMDHPQARVSVFGPGGPGGDLLHQFTRAMSPPNFPIGAESLRGRWSWNTIDEGRFETDGFEVVVREIPHKGGKTLGYRVSDGNGSFAYLSDHMPQSMGPGPSGWGALHDAAVELATDADVLVHDAQYDADELTVRGAFGHAAAEYAVELGETCGVGHVVLFHHDPLRSDDEIDARLTRLRSVAGVRVTAAREGDVVPVAHAAAFATGGVEAP